MTETFHSVPAGTIFNEHGDIFKQTPAPPKWVALQEALIDEGWYPHAAGNLNAVFNVDKDDVRLRVIFQDDFVVLERKDIPRAGRTNAWRVLASAPYDRCVIEDGFLKFTADEESAEVNQAEEAIKEGDETDV